MENSASGSHGPGAAFIPSGRATLEAERTGGYKSQGKVNSHKEIFPTGDELKLRSSGGHLVEYDRAPSHQEVCNSHLDEH